MSAGTVLVLLAAFLANQRWPHQRLFLFSSHLAGLAECISGEGMLMGPVVSFSSPILPMKTRRRLLHVL